MGNSTAITDVMANAVSLPLNLVLDSQKLCYDSVISHFRSITEMLEDSFPFSLWKMEEVQSRFSGKAIENLIGLHKDILNAGAVEISRPIAYAAVAARRIPEPVWWGEHKVMEIPGLEGLVVRHFKKNKRKLSAPLCIGAPMAGHTSHIIHHKPSQSMIETAHDAGINDVFAFDYTSADISRKGEDIGSYLEKNKIAVDAIRSQVYGKDVKMNLVGCCQNGWQLAAYTALWPDDVKWLVPAGAPIDTQAGDSDIKKIVNIVPMQFFENIVASKGGLIDGSLMVFGFWNLDSLGRANDAVSLYNNIHDERFVGRHVDFYNWYRGHTIMMPGRFFLQAVDDLFKRNLMVKGEFYVDIFGERKRVDLSNIGRKHGHKVVTIGGTKDNITDPIDCHNLSVYADLDGGTGYDGFRTSPDEVDRLLGNAGEKGVQLTAEAGHLGLFISRSVLRDYYLPIFQRMAKIN